ncbi:MAG: hypothetical protein ACRD40_17115 [Candidatus Acidiferrales bacterium]
MKMTRVVLSLSAVGLFVLCFPAKAQNADEQKLTEIENTLAKQTGPGPAEGAAMKQYLYEGNLNQLNAVGRVGTLPKSRVVELSSKPDPNDPNMKSATAISNVHVDMYGDTALVSYKVTNTDTGHKDAGLNATDHYGCLDTFVKRNGQWYVIGNACAPSAPLPASEWDAAKRAIAQEPKDLQNAYH